MPTALDNGNLLGARAAAIELKHVGLAEALELLSSRTLLPAAEVLVRWGGDR